MNELNKLSLPSLTSDDWSGLLFSIELRARGTSHLTLTIEMDHDAVETVADVGKVI